MQAMPDFLPDRLEAGTHNVSGIAGLDAGLEFIKSTRIDRIRRHEQILLERTVRYLEKIPDITFWRAKDPALQTGVLSFCVKEKSSFDVSEALARHGIAVRAGLHCAPFAHRTVGTLPDGTVRLSFSAYSRAEEVDAFARTLRRIVR